MSIDSHDSSQLTVMTHCRHQSLDCLNCFTNWHTLLSVSNCAAIKVSGPVQHLKCYYAGRAGLPAGFGGMPNIPLPFQGHHGPASVGNTMQNGNPSELSTNPDLTAAEASATATAENSTTDSPCKYGMGSVNNQQGVCSLFLLVSLCFGVMQIALFLICRCASTLLLNCLKAEVSLSYTK